MAKKATSEEQDGIVNMRTGAVQLLTQTNQNLLKRRDMKKTKIAREGDDGPWKEVDGGDFFAALAGSGDLQRIGLQLVNLKDQRQQLITSACKLPGGDEYLQNLGVYDGEDDEQYVDPDDLKANNAGLPSKAFTYPEVGVQDATEELEAAASKKAPAKKRSTAKKDATKDENGDEFADL